MLDKLTALPARLSIWVEDLKFTVHVKLEEEEMERKKGCGIRDIAEKEDVQSGCSGSPQKGKQKSREVEDDDVTNSHLNFELHTHNEDMIGSMDRGEIWTKKSNSFAVLGQVMKLKNGPGGDGQKGSHLNKQNKSNLGLLLGQNFNQEAREEEEDSKEETRSPSLSSRSSDCSETGQRYASRIYLRATGVLCQKGKSALEVKRFSETVRCLIEEVMAQRESPQSLTRSQKSGEKLQHKD